VNSNANRETLWSRSNFWRRVAVAILFITAAATQTSGDAQSIGAFEDHSDVGVTPKAGSAAYDSKSHDYTVTGGGANMWATADAFHFVWKRVSGDVTITARVALQGTEGNEHRKAGLMIRQGLGPGDAYADAVVHGNGLTSLQYRETAGAQTLEVRARKTAPRFLRLVRQGNRFTLFAADSKHHFTQVGYTNVVLYDPVYVGLAVCAHDADALQAAAFSDVQLKTRSTGR
jgi:regulation of enolase protein 1 (concanavalin A-like superfamily)